MRVATQELSEFNTIKALKRHEAILREIEQIPHVVKLVESFFVDNGAYFVYERY